MASVTAREIFSQGTVLKNTYETNLVLAEKLAAIIKKRKINQIVVAARGSSNNACLYFKYICEIFAGIPVNFAHPSVVTLYQGKLNLKNTVVIGVSQSGRAADVKTVLAGAAAQGAITVAITNDLTSPLALGTQYHFYLDVDEEKGVAATKTFTAQMLVLEMIVEALAADNCRLPARNQKLPVLINQVLELKPQIDALAEHFVDVNEVFLLSRGINLAIGNEIALKLQEMCYINARNYAISDFHHGPIALVSEKSRIIILSTLGHTERDVLEIVETIRPTGADITAICDSTELAAMCNRGVILPAGDETFSPFACVVAGQLLACSLAEKRSLDPDSPRRMKKPTITR